MTDIMCSCTEDFRLSTGLFLLLGFSKTEERILRPVTNGGAVEALIPLKRLLRNVAASMGVSIISKDNRYCFEMCVLLV